MNLSLTQETENPTDAQRARSRAGYERTARRFRKLGLLPEQLAERFPPIKREDWVTGDQKLELSTVVCQVEAGDFKVSGDVESTFPVDPNAYEAPTAPGFAFRIEYQCLVTKDWLPMADLKTRANKASDLLPECQRLAKEHCGENMRFRIIRPLPGARAVHRIAARKNKQTGEIELYAWST